VRRRRATYSLAVLLMGATAIAALLIDWQIQSDLHSVLETGATILAATVGALGLVRYHARRQLPYLILGVGFLGTAFLDGYHGLVTGSWFHEFWPTPPASMAPWSWYAPQAFMAVVTLAFWQSWDWDDSDQGVDEWMVYAGVGALTAASFLFFAFVPLPRAYYPELAVGRPQELVLAVLFLVALVGLIRTRLWQTSVFHHWIVVSLILAVGAQVTMALSYGLFDVPFHAAHLLRVISYCLVLHGFLVDLFYLHKTAEADANRAELARAAADAAHAAAEGRALELAASEARYRAFVEGAAVALWDEDLTGVKQRLDRIQAGGVADLKSYLFSSPDLVSDLAREIKVHAISQETLRMYGASSQDELFMEMDRVFGPDYKATFVDELLAIASDATSHESEALTHTLEGRPVWVSKRVRFIPEPDGLRGVMSLTDVSSIKAAEEQLRARTGELARSNAELDDFAYIASHDLKEPLRGISNFAHFLLEDHGGQLDQDAVEKVEMLIRISGRMERQIQSLLEYSRVTRSEPRRDPVPVSDVVTEVLESLQSHPELAKTEVRIASDLPVVRADRELTSRIFSNLITNAIKYNDKTERCIEVGWFDEGVGHADVDSTRPPVFFVRDNGIGIREKHIESVFRIFKRLHGRDQFGGGAGAGLTIVKKIVEAQEGRVWVESELGQGTTFYFTVGGRVPISATAPPVGAAGV